MTTIDSYSNIHSLPLFSSLPTVPVPTVSLPSDISVTYDDSLSITCNVTSLMRPSSIIWYHNDTMISSEAQPSFTATGVLDTYTSVLVRNDVVLNDSGVYRCEAQNMAGRGNDSVTVSVTGKYMYCCYLHVLLLLFTCM